MNGPLADDAIGKVAPAVLAVEVRSLAAQWAEWRAEDRKRHDDLDKALREVCDRSIRNEERIKTVAGALGIFQVILSVIAGAIGVSVKGP